MGTSMQFRISHEMLECRQLSRYTCWIFLWTSTATYKNTYQLCVRDILGNESQGSGESLTHQSTPHMGQAG